MNITIGRHEGDVHRVYIDFRSLKNASVRIIRRTVTVTPDIIIDLDGNDRIVGIELLNTEGLEIEEPKRRRTRRSGARRETRNTAQGSHTDKVVPIPKKEKP